MTLSRKEQTVLDALSKATAPLSSQQLAKQLPSRHYSSADVGHFLQRLESDGLVRRIKKGYHNLWEVA